MRISIRMMMTPQIIGFLCVCIFSLQSVLYQTKYVTEKVSFSTRATNKKKSDHLISSSLYYFRFTGDFCLFVCLLRLTYNLDFVFGVSRRLCRHFDIFFILKIILWLTNLQTYFATESICFQICRPTLQQNQIIIKPLNKLYIRIQLLANPTDLKFPHQPESPIQSVYF